MSAPRVLISLVTFNSQRYLEACLRSVERQTFTDRSIVLWDNASNDDTLRIAAGFSGLLETTHFSTRNVGFCAAHNHVIADSASEYVLVLNPDVILAPSFLERMVDALGRDASAGAATGKLWRWVSGDLPVDAFPDAPAARILDTTGIYLTPNQRHLDRGAGERDEGQYEAAQYVFGASGAAALYRRAMLEDVRAGSDYFDEAFFAYREDADLAWRGQWMGWKCLYVPSATAYHVRRVLPERRASLPPAVNMHSFKNRFLLRVKNMDTGTYLRYALQITARDLAALAYVLFRERTSLRALPLLLRALPAGWRVRRALRRHRRVRPADVRAWFTRSHR